jgi:hypothetical protein
VEVKRIRAEGMEADGFNKPYDPVYHEKFAMKLMKSINGDNGWALNKVKMSEVQVDKKGDPEEWLKRNEVRNRYRFDCLDGKINGFV